MNEEQRQFRADSERRLRDQAEEIHRGPVLTFDWREAFRTAREVALRLLRAVPTSDLTDDRLAAAREKGEDEIRRYIAVRSAWLAAVCAENPLMREYAKDARCCGERAREELRLELEAYRTERLRETQGSGGPSDGRLPGEITLSDAKSEFNVPRAEWYRATSRHRSDARFLPHRRVGRNLFVQRDVAKKFAEDYEARREQRTVGSRSSAR